MRTHVLRPPGKRTGETPILPYLESTGLCPITTYLDSSVPQINLSLLFEFSLRNEPLWTHAFDEFCGNLIHLSPVACIDQSSTRARKEMLLEHHHGKFGALVEISIERRKIADVPKVRL
jgi:hypothetical protein